MPKIKNKAKFTSLRLIGLICVFVFILVLTILKPSKDGITNIQSINQHLSSLVAQPFQWLHHLTSKYFTFSPPPSEQLKNAYIQLKSEYTELKQEHHQLSQLLNYTPDNVTNISTGKIISSPNGLFAKTLLVNVGAFNGVQKDDIAITKEGLVGRIIDVQDHQSEILPVNHAASKIVGVESKTGVKLLISGRYQLYMIAEYVTDPLLLKKNMIIRTLSDGKTIPHNIPIGKIIDPYAKPIQIKLAVNFKNLQHIRIVRFNRPPLAEDIKQEE